MAPGYLPGDAVLFLAIVLAVLASAAWLGAAIHFVWSLNHLSGKSSVARMLIAGHRWFDRENFTPRGQQIQQRGVHCALAFFVCVLGGIGVAAISSSSRSP
jgi:hypothetical protein